MSAIFPFAALRPAPHAAAAVAAVPYDVVNSDEARALASGNPLSFLHVSRPEIDLPPVTSPYAEAVYERARANFNQLRSAAPLVVEEAPSFYIYQLEMGGHVQTGMAACYSIDEYDRELIKKHEKTRPDKEDDRTRHMLAIGAQTGPVFLTYRASRAVDGIVSRVVREPALFDFSAADGVRHQVWRVPETENQTVVDAFAKIESLYIADGHHRAASAARARQALKKKDSAPSALAHGASADRSAALGSEADRVLAVAFPDNQMQVLPYNRVVSDLRGLSPAAFLDRLKERLTVREGGPATPAGKGSVAMYLGGKWHTITLTQPVAPKPSGGGGPKPQGEGGSGNALDVDVLQSSILEPVLGIADVRTDKRIDFVGGIRGTRELEQLVDSGKFAVAFSLFPVSVDDLMRIADAGGIMPPKSTWFEPKLRDGLLSHLI
jgi:uncharacterized protein (DUF1015 family)